MPVIAMADDTDSRLAANGWRNTLMPDYLASYVTATWGKTSSCLRM